ncbi:hypothetical protein [Sinorhizobium sp. RAC02]|uniref:hypothetical protein n=1 Tax=Sinorhizobium sp. RAC02 TaxID=1842534 RepID=UPI00336BB3E0
MTGESPEPDDCLKQADKALNRAKENGRRQAFFYEHNHLFEVKRQRAAMRGRI